jgi:hypothetical protein
MALKAGLNALGYFSSPLDDCLFMKTSGGKRIYATIYVDDLLIFFPKVLTSIWEADKKRLTTEFNFKIKDIGECQWILNMTLIRNRKARTILLSQRSYVDQVLSKHPPTSDRLVASPYRFKDATVCEEGMDGTPLNAEDHSKFRSIIGELIYLSTITRMDILHAVKTLASALHAPCVYHAQAADRILQYLYHHRDDCLIFKGNPQRSPNDVTATLDFKVYTDSDWADSKKDRHSISAWVSTLNNRPISFRCVKQTAVALSSTEAEVYALGEGGRECKFLQEWLRHYFAIDQVITLCGDNIGSHLYADHPTDHEKTKHYDVKIHFIREYIQGGVLKTHKVHTSVNLADLMTKNTKITRHEQLRKLTMVTP